MIYLFGSNGFIGKNLYLFLKKQKKEITLLDRKNFNINFIEDNDVVINCAGVNRCDTYEEYEEGNVNFMKLVLANLPKQPFIVHLSSFMVNGFEKQNLDALSNYQKWFISSKLKCEEYLAMNYPKEKMCILRPSNIYGYNCEPYYNNILCTLVYEKITKEKKITNVNKNSTRNFLSIDGLCESIYNVINSRTHGLYSVLSNNSINLFNILKILYEDEFPTHINVNEGNIDNIEEATTKTIIVNENIQSQIQKLEKDMKIYIELKKIIKKEKLNELNQSRGCMTEIVNGNFKRLYKISVNKSFIRGEHYHEKQIEQFFVNKGKILFLFAQATSKHIVFMDRLDANELVEIHPNIIHTVCNDYVDNENEIIITSTQEFIKDSTPDTFYIGIFN